MDRVTAYTGVNGRLYKNEADAAGDWLANYYSYIGKAVAGEGGDATPYPQLRQAITRAAELIKHKNKAHEKAATKAKKAKTKKRR